MDRFCMGWFILKLGIFEFHMIASGIPTPVAVLFMVIVWRGLPAVHQWKNVGESQPANSPLTIRHGHLKRITLHWAWRIGFARFHPSA
ncbi:MAG: hypothetical protein AUG74_05290 [Bacteroidetes bacterium 13_1_20CM_4_60_6]|nr:MAG: hypothetical protein AUG74_05290 [Bacteroidetes bacterium 13_1_20CM_4_60_6]